MQDLWCTNMGAEAVVQVTEVSTNLPFPEGWGQAGVLNVCSAAISKKSLKQTPKLLGEGNCSLNTINWHLCAVTLSGLRNGLFRFQVLWYWFQSTAFPKSPISKQLCQNFCCLCQVLAQGFHSYLISLSYITGEGFVCALVSLHVFFLIVFVSGVNLPVYLHFLLPIDGGM